MLVSDLDQPSDGTEQNLMRFTDYTANLTCLLERLFVLELSPNFLPVEDYFCNLEATIYTRPTFYSTVALELRHRQLMQLWTLGLLSKLETRAQSYI